MFTDFSGPVSPASRMSPRIRDRRFTLYADGCFFDIEATRPRTRPWDRPPGGLARLTPHTAGMAVADKRLATTRGPAPPNGIRIRNSGVRIRKVPFCRHLFRQPVCVGCQVLSGGLVFTPLGSGFSGQARVGASGPLTLEAV